ncbi:hypothetical protein SLS55_010016 [Diplodia seriata]|uniref:Uncharacterized protein n=1 Tax=Diplodia seriata TaxID=420778 RepID=A0ABR3C298_9PEZI
MSSDRRNDEGAPMRTLSLAEFHYFVRRRDQHVGTVSTVFGCEEGIPVFARISDYDEIEFHAPKLQTFLSHKHIAWTQGLSREPLEKRMDILRKRVDGFILAAPLRLFNEFEYYEMRDNPRLLSVGFALLRHHHLIPRLAEEVLRADRQVVVPPTFDRDLETAKGLLDRLTAAFPEAAGHLHAMSLAGAAGYYAQNRRHLPMGLKVYSRDARYDIFLLIISKMFWDEMSAAEEEDVDDDQDNKQWLSTMPIDRIVSFDHEVFDEEYEDDDDSVVYNTTEAPAFMTEQRMALHREPVVKCPDDIKALETLSLVFSAIPRCRPVPEGYGLCVDAGSQQTLVGSGGAGAAEMVEMSRSMFCRPPLVTRHFAKEWRRFAVGGQDPVFSDGGIPEFRAEDYTGQMAWVRMLEWRRYLKRCAEYAPNALAVAFLLEMHGSIQSADHFKHWCAALDHCLDNDLLRIEEDEWTTWWDALQSARTT